ncbi:MAG: Low molecular weight phosphotyrosine protein phosphatase, partial [Actinomycetota bacterium]
PDSITERSYPYASQLLTNELISQADLVLTMERSHRSRVAELSPAARSKTFTIPEAAELAEFVKLAIEDSDSEFGDNRELGFAELDPTKKLQWFTAELNEARGFISPILDEIKDAHGADSIPHELAFTQIEKFATAFLKAQSEIVNA